MHEQMLKITMQLVILSGEGRWGQNLTNPTRHRLRWSKESETHQPKDPNRKCLQAHSGRVRLHSISAQSCTSEASPRWEKNWQHCSQEFYWRMWIDSNTHQTAVFPVLRDSFWAMKRGWWHLCHLWVEAGKAQMWFSSLSLFCPRSCMFQMVHM